MPRTGLKIVNSPCGGCKGPCGPRTAHKALVREFCHLWLCQIPHVSTKACGSCTFPQDMKQGKSEGFDSCDRPSNLKLDSNHQFFRPCDRKIWWMNSKNWQFSVLCNLDIWRMTLQNNRAPLLCHFKLCVSFHTHWRIQISVTVRKRPIWVKFDDF